MKMMNAYKLFSVICLITLIGLTGCKKSLKTVLVPNNEAPYYDKKASVKVENYVNRLFIDLIGREPFDTELNEEVSKLIAADLSTAAREELIVKLQSDKTFRPGDSSYWIAANKRLYDLLCIRLCEGKDEHKFFNRIAESFNLAIKLDSTKGRWAQYAIDKAEKQKLLNAGNARWDYMNKIIGIEEYCARLINNYETYNFTDSYNGAEENTVKYTFNDLLFRPATKAEFNIGYDMIQNNASGVLFGVSGHSKGDYFEIITHSNEFYEGTIIWLYKTFLSREPSVEETYLYMQKLPFDKNILRIQKDILKSNEYAHF